MLSKMKWALALNLFFSIFELIGGLWLQSMAIVSDALHDFGDALSLALGIWMEKKSQQSVDHRYSYGYRRFSLLASVFTGGILIAGSVFIFASSVERIFNPTPVNSLGMIFFAVLGVLVNAFAFRKIKEAGHSHGHAHGHHHGHHHEHGSAQQCDHEHSKHESTGHLRMWELHFIEDLVGWIIVLIGAVCIHLFQIFWLDPVLAMGLSIWMLWNVVKNLRGTVEILLQSTPSATLIPNIETFFGQQTELEGHHHLHVWSLDGQQHILTGHLVLKKNFTLEELGPFKTKMKAQLREKFRIKEATLEFEWEGEHCSDPLHQ